MESAKANSLILKHMNATPFLPLFLFMEQTKYGASLRWIDAVITQYLNCNT